MFPWTNCISSLNPIHESEDHRTKVFAVTARNPMHREVIVKQVECETEESANRAIEEGRIAEANPHPNICACLGSLKELNERQLWVNGCEAVISPKMPKSLQEEIKERISTRTSFSEEELWKLANQLISAYAFLQTKVILTQGIAHRDIKPDNILLDPEGNVKVCDFGFAKVIDLSGPEMHTLLGTVPFFSPALRAALISGNRDISKAQHNAFKSDVYSLGVSLVSATILEIPHFFSELNRLQENINTRLKKIKKYSEDWVNLLGEMLVVDEMLRPDFVSLNKADSPLPFADDEPFAVARIVGGQENPLNIAVKCGLAHVRVSPTRFEEVPCMISLKGLEVDQNQNNYSTDIVAVIDVSESMRGTLIGMVKQSLKKWIDLQGSRDRLSIVTFSDSAERKCPLLCCTDQGKQELKKIVAGLKTQGRTKLSAGFVMGMDVLEQRRKLNLRTTMILFSDGRDTQKQNPLPICQEKYAARSDNKVTVHVFGYGDKVDSKLLEALAAEGKGMFHHITKSQDIEKAFALTHGNITSVVARNVQVRVTVNPGPVPCTIPLIYSKDRADVFSLPDITVSQQYFSHQKDMVFMLKAEYKQLAKTTIFDAVTIVVSYEDNEGAEYQRSANLNVRFVPWADVEPPHDQTVFMNWYRVKGAYCLMEVRELADNQQLGEAKECLEHGIEMLQMSGFEAHEYIAQIIRDLRKAEKFVQSNETWERGGDAHFASISYSHCSQSATVRTLHYSTLQQRRAAARMNDNVLRDIPEES